MNLYLHELKSLRKTTIIWTCAIIAVAVLYLSIYPGIFRDATDFKKLIDKYPAPVRASLGLSIDSITSMLGYYSVIFLFITLLGAIQAMNFGASIISKETRLRTSDFLLTKPISRISIISGKLMAALTAILVTNVIYGITAFAVAVSVKTSDFSGKLFFMITLTLLFIQLIFLAIGFFASVVIPKLKTVLPVSLGTVFGFFFIGMLLSTSKNDATRYLSPFKYFDTAFIIAHSSYEMPYIIASVVIIITAVTAGYIIYTKKDIHAVS